MSKGIALLATTLLLAACGETANLSVAEGTGPSPKLPAPTKTLLPTINIADATGWPEGAAPTPAQGLAVRSFLAGSTSCPMATCWSPKPRRRPSPKAWMAASAAGS